MQGRPTASPKVANVAHEELIEIIRRIQAVDVPHPRVTDLILWPPPELVNASPDTTVDAAFGYRSIDL